MQCYDVKTKRAGHLHTVTPTFPLPNAHFSRILTKGIPFNLEYIRLINISCQSSSNRRDPAHFPVLFQFLPNTLHGVYLIDQLNGLNMTIAMPTAHISLVLETP